MTSYIHQTESIQKERSFKSKYLHENQVVVIQNEAVLKHITPQTSTTQSV